VSLDKRFDYVYSARLSLRGEDVDIHSIQTRSARLEILNAEGHSTLTSIGISGRRDTTNRGLIPSRGTTTTLGWDRSVYSAVISASSAYPPALITTRRFPKTCWIARQSSVCTSTPGTLPATTRSSNGSTAVVSDRSAGSRIAVSAHAPDRMMIVSAADFSFTARRSQFPLYAESLRGVVFTDFGHG